ncbi:sclerostin domain-containing protein 1a isoform X1 [Osmerus eperlanus]|uniref:sclerostin domain-containing protein 1a isoform X1 n=2 Tax=Osmerus eperlanus TaxID=29151 RepID=UPI002E10A921
MYLNSCEPCRLIFIYCVLLRCCQALKNDAENIYSLMAIPVMNTSSNVSLNRARIEGKGATNGVLQISEQNQVGCRELRSTKYISDGQCTSINPIKELVCAGECLPTQILPNWIGGGYRKKFWSRRNSQQWRCVNDKTRTQRILLQCQDSSTRTYKITVVTSCKCMRYSRQHNESGHKELATLSESQQLHKQKSKTKKRLGKRKMNNNWHEVEP